MNTINVLSYEEASASNRAIFDQLKKALSFVPNLYATFAHSETALGTYLTLQNAKSSLSAKEREVVNLVVSQANHCQYCLAAHTALGKMVGFSSEQILEIRSARISFDSRLQALAKFTLAVVENRGHETHNETEAFLTAGWTKGNLVDVMMVIGDKIISNYLHAVTQIPIDFPRAPELPNA